MKKLLSLLYAVVLCGCVSSHLKSTSFSHASAPAPVVVAPVSPELQAVRSAQVTPQVTPQVPPAIQAAKVAVSAPVLVESSVKTVVTPKSHKLNYFLLVAALTVAEFWAGWKYGLPLVKKVLAWVKSKNVVADIKKLIPLIALCFFCFSGCIGLPKTGLPTSSGAPSVKVAVSGSPARKAIQTLMNWQATLSVVGGLALLAFGGLAIYGGQLLPGIKLVVAGFLLPICGIWFAYHWLAVVIVCLIVTAGYLLVTHYTLVAPALRAVESWAQSVEARLVPGAKAAPTLSEPAVAGLSSLISGTVQSAKPAPTAASVLAAIHKV